MSDQQKLLAYRALKLIPPETFGEQLLHDFVYAKIGAEKYYTMDEKLVIKLDKFTPYEITT